MNFVRMLTIEAGMLVVAFAMAFLWFRSGKTLLFNPQWLVWILARNHRAVLAVIAAALLARGLMLPFVGVPIPRINDEFSYLLMSDTFSHHRLANPTPPEWEHFETFHINFQPTYHAKYPVGQGMTLAFGQSFFHQPWIGVYLITALFCGAICWTLQAFLPAGWALLGGLFAVFRTALFCYWMNSYWGGSLAALGGALALGALVRLFDPSIVRSNHNRFALASLFAFALLILAISRPYEGLAFSLPLLAYFGYRFVHSEIPLATRIRLELLPVAVIGIAGLSFMGYYNARTTGGPLTMPYVLNERMYSSVPLFIGQEEKPAPAFRHDIFPKFFERFEQDYHSTQAFSGIVALELPRLITNWWFYVGIALSIPALLGILSSFTDARLRIALVASMITAVAVAMSIYTQPHYFAVATVTVYLFALIGLRYLWQQGTNASRAFVVAVCFTVIAASVTKQSGSSSLYTNFHYGDARAMAEQQMRDKPGRHLLLVSYGPTHDPADDLVYNKADFESERILWARSMGTERDAELCKAYLGRTFWSVVSDDKHVAITPLDLCH